MPIQRGELSVEVRALREARQKQDAALLEIVQPRIDAQIAACRIVSTQLQEWHQELANTTDLDLTGYSRGAAVWLLSGRCLGLLEVLLVQAEAGIDNEALIAGRAVHEANRILMAFCADAADDELVRLWLDDKGKHGYVKQGHARAVNTRFEEKLNQAMEAQGINPVGTTGELSVELYDRLSRIVHSRRSSCINSVWREGREMAYGRAPSQLRRASTVEWTSSVTVEIVQAVGDALRAFYGQGFFTQNVVPLIQSIGAVRESAPLDEESVLAAVAGQ